MMTWKDQLRLAGRGLRWLFWPADQKTWANIATAVIVAAMTIAINYQLWLAVLAAFILFFPVSRLGRKRD
jgi:hypothetical protein